MSRIGLGFYRNNYRAHMHQLKENVPQELEVGKEHDKFYPHAAFKSIEEYIWELETALLEVEPNSGRHDDD